MTEICKTEDDINTNTCTLGNETQVAVTSAIDDALQTLYQLRLKGISEEAFLIAVTSFLMLVMSMYVLTWIFKKPKPFLAGAALWFVWFLWAVVYQQTIGSDEIYKRWGAAYDETGKVIPAIYKALSAWCYLLAPFLSDFWGLALTVNRQLSWPQRLVVLFVCVTIYSVARSVRALRRHQDNIRSGATVVLFAASFLLVAPAIWWMLGYLPPSYFPYLISLLTFVVPFIFSVWAFNTPASRISSVRWLSYWACVPVLTAFRIFVLQRWPDSLDLQRLFIITLIWLQAWMGSRHVFHFLRLILRGLKLTLPSEVPAVLRICGVRPSWHSIAMFHRIANDVKDKKLLLASGGVFIIIALSQILSLVSGFLSIAIWVGAALDSERTLRHQLVPLYRQKLAFWILAALFELVVQIPFLGFWCAMWRPLVLSVALVQGEAVLSTLSFLVSRSRPVSRPLEGPPDAGPPSYEAAVQGAN